MSKRGSLTAEEYKILRIACGLTQEEARKLHGLKEIRTIQRWEDGSSWISKIAEEKILWANEVIQRSVDNAIQIYKDALMNHCEKPETVVLIQYSNDDFIVFVPELAKLGFPNNVHRAMILRLYLAFREYGQKVSIVEMNVDDYIEFLESRNLEDTQDARAAWAGFYFDKIILN